MGPLHQLFPLSILQCLIFLCSNWTISDSPFSKAFSTIISGTSFFCQTWLKLDSWFWSYHLHPTACIQRSYDCKSSISPEDKSGTEPLMHINILALKKRAKLSENLWRFFLWGKNMFFFLVQIVLANPQYYILSVWKSLSAVKASQNNRLKRLPYPNCKLLAFVPMLFNNVCRSIKMDGSFPS